MWIETGTCQSFFLSVVGGSAVVQCGGQSAIVGGAVQQLHPRLWGLGMILVPKFPSIRMCYIRFRTLSSQCDRRRFLNR